MLLRREQQGRGTLQTCKRQGSRICTCYRPMTMDPCLSEKRTSKSLRCAPPIISHNLLFHQGRSPQHAHILLCSSIVCWRCGVCSL